VEISAFQLVVVSGVEKINFADGLYPNPVNDKLTIHFGEGPGGKEVMLYGLNGQLLTSQKTSSGEVVLDISDLPQGMYVVKILTTAGSPRLIVLSLRMMPPNFSEVAIRFGLRLHSYTVFSRPSKKLCIGQRRAIIQLTHQ
jgi:hypothetical protein